MQLSHKFPLIIPSANDIYICYSKYSYWGLLNMPSVCLWIMDPHSWAPMKNTNHGNEVLPQDTVHLIQRPCYQQGSSCHFSLFSAALWNLANSRPVHFLMSSHLLFCLPCLYPLLTVPWKVVLAKYDERETCPYHFSLHLLTMVRWSSCNPIACWILAQTSSFVTWSLYEMHIILQ